MPAWKLVLMILAAVLVKSGIWVIPTIESSRAIAANPFVNPFSDSSQHFLFWNWLGPFLAWVVGARSRLAFILFHLAFSLAFTFLFFRTVFSRFSDRTARSALVLFSILPVSATAYFWVGYDSITLFIMMFALAYPRHALVTLLAGIALGMQHFEQGFFAAAGLLSAAFLSKKYDEGPFSDARYPVAFGVRLLLGVTVGKLALMALFSIFAISVNSGRILWLGEHFGLLVKMFYFHAQYIVYSVLGLGWLIAIKYADRGRRAVPFFLAIFGLCMLLPVSGDQTRVLAIITFPLIAVSWLLNEEFLETFSRTGIAIVLVVWAIMPMGWVWGGIPLWSVFPADVAVLSNALFGRPGIPGGDWWPFYR